MLSYPTLFGFSLLYLFLLFGIAYWGDKYTTRESFKPIIYSLGLGVYCTSWAFYGVTGRAAETGWWMAPTYVGAILVYVFCWPLLLKVARLCKTYKITSLADFVARRYGQSSGLGGLIALVSVIAVVPYMSIQIRAISTGFESVSSPAAGPSGSIDNALVFTVVLAIFSVLFGTRRLRTSEHNPGLMLAIAFESLVKLGTIVAVGLFVCFSMFDGFGDLFAQAEQQQISNRLMDTPPYVYWVQVFVGVLMMFCLPRQFHTCFIENNSTNGLAVSRWVFPAYLLGMGVFALPLAYAGNLLLGSDSDPDRYLLQLPLLADSLSMSLLVFIGGFSAASSMIIVASIVLSIMVSNELVTPWLLRKELVSGNQTRVSSARLVLVRRITIVVVLVLAYGYHLLTQDVGLLANTGLTAMALLAQFAPAMLLGVVWTKANRSAAFGSIIVGSLMWAYTLFLPTVLNATNSHGQFAFIEPLSWLQPTALFGVELEFIAHGVLFSLLANTATFVYLSYRSAPCLAETLQVARYTGRTASGLPQPPQDEALTVGDVIDLLARFTAPHEAEAWMRDVYPSYDSARDMPADTSLQQKALDELSAIVGGPSAKLVFESAKRDRNRLLTDVVELVDEASEVLKFNRSLLQATIQNMEQGIAVVDKSLQLVAWNRRYIEMFSYPSDAIYIGRPVADIIRFNGERGLLKDTDIEAAVSKRLEYLRQGKPYKYQRVHASGTVIEISGNPLPGGGFVTTYTDVTEFVETQKNLEEVNALLEQRVAQRTQDLTQANTRLSAAKKQAEQANVDKTRYFAAVSHDLLQPINAASLFSSVLKEKSASLDSHTDIRELSTNIRQSLDNAEQLLTSVLELTKLDAGAVRVRVDDFPISQILTPIVDEYALLLREKGLSFRHSIIDAGVRSDQKLLRRVIQNLMSNATKYTDEGGIELTVTDNGNSTLTIVVADTGRGIDADDQARIFDDFVQLDNALSESGLGLGLAVASRICRILGHTLTLDSTLGKGSAFSVTLPYVALASTYTAKPSAGPVNKKDLVDVRILVLDNEEQVLKAMEARLIEWGCEVFLARDKAEVLHTLDHHSIDLIIADFHLDHGVTGIEVVQSLPQQFQHLPVIVNSADHTPEIRESVADEGYGFLNKPTKPAALKRLIKRYLAQ